MTSGSTSGLWCRQVIQAEVGENTAFAVTKNGQLLAWGGRNQWWEEINTPRIGGGPSGGMTARSAQLLHMKGKTAYVLTLCISFRLLVLDLKILKHTIN